VSRPLHRRTWIFHPGFGAPNSKVWGLDRLAARGIPSRDQGTRWLLNDRNRSITDRLNQGVIVTVSYQHQPDSSAPEPPEAVPLDRLASVDAALDRFPELAGPRQIEELPGGLTNRNYRVTTNSGRFVARFWSLDTALLAIDRDAEHYNALVAAEGGVGPAVIGYHPDDGVLVISWLDGKTLDAADLNEPAVLDRVAAACRQLHEGARFVNDFNMFAVQHQYLELVTERGFRIPSDYLDYQPKVNQIALALSSYPAATVPCHNDLLASNLIDDGEHVSTTNTRATTIPPLNSATSGARTTCRWRHSSSW
jgi:Phosphotransferase enzyme family